MVKTSHSWRCRSSSPRFCGDSISSSRIQTGSGNYTTIGSSRRPGLMSRSRRDTDKRSPDWPNNGLFACPRVSQPTDTEHSPYPARLRTDKNPDCGAPCAEAKVFFTMPSPEGESSAAISLDTLSVATLAVVLACTSRAADGARGFDYRMAMTCRRMVLVHPDKSRRAQISPATACLR